MKKLSLNAILILLFGVALAILLTLFLRETGPAVRPAAASETGRTP